MTLSSAQRRRRCHDIRIRGWAELIPAAVHDNIPVWAIGGTEGGLHMLGNIRSREVKCGKCGKAWTHKVGRAMFCEPCKTMPKTFYLWIYWRGEKIRILRDIDGRIPRSYQDARDLQKEISRKISDSTFILEHYMAADSKSRRCGSLLDRWRLTRKDCAPSTLREVDRYIEKYLRPFLGNKKSMEISTRDVEDFRLSLPGHLSLKTIKNIQSELKSFCLWLHRRGDLPSLPVFKPIIPPSPVIHVIDKEDARKAIDKLSLHHRKVFSFMILHPVRPGEVRALKASDFNLKNMTVHISRAFSLKELRSRKSKKDYILPIHPDMDLSFLDKKFGEDFAFLNEHGRPYKSENLRRIWHRACKKAEIPKIKMYSATRHSFATRMLDLGVDSRVISKLLGHSDPGMMEKYTKFKVETLRAAISLDAKRIGAQEVHKNASGKQ